jgi:hypothetical protein
MSAQTTVRSPIPVLSLSAIDEELFIDPSNGVSSRANQREPAGVKDAARWIVLRMDERFDRLDGEFLQTPKEQQARRSPFQSRDRGRHGLASNRDPPPRPGGA